MKLLSKYGRVSAAWLLLIFLAGSIAYFFAVRYVLLQQVDETLETEREETETHIRLYGVLPNIPSTSDQQIVFQETEKSAPALLQTVKIQKENAVKTIEVRRLSYSVSVDGKWYRYAVSIPLEHTEALLKNVVLVTVALIAALLLALYFINRLLARRLMNPFYRTVAVLQKYSPATGEIPRLPQTDIDEFQTLNKSIETMTHRVQEDYRAMQSFTAHAAHELQTPLAIMHNRLEALAQTISLTDAEAQHMESLQRTLRNLSRMQSALLLLTKVEAGQFAHGEVIDIAALVEGKCAEYEEFFASARLIVEREILPVTVKGNTMLCGVLVGNLLSNAARYNYGEGTVSVQVSTGSFRVSNTSYLPALDAQRLFTPFYRHADSGRSGNGLGLPIVKQICDAAGWMLTYSHDGQMHRFEVRF